MGMDAFLPSLMIVVKVRRSKSANLVFSPWKIFSSANVATGMIVAAKELYVARDTSSQ